MKQFISKYRIHLYGLLITFVSIIITTLLNYNNVFNLLEYKVYDVKFLIRGPLSGEFAYNKISKKTEPFVDNNQNGLKDEDESYTDLNSNLKWDKGMNVVFVDLDDESWRLIPNAWPYPRGEVWTKVVRNLSDAGAKVIVLDIEFDKPDHTSEYILPYLDDNQLKSFVHGDLIFKNAIQYAESLGTSVVLASKRASESTRKPAEYIQLPTEELMSIQPETGLVGEYKASEDAVTREYIIYSIINNDYSKVYLSLGLKAVKEYLDIPDEVIPLPDIDNEIINYGPLSISTYGHNATFLINYYGPTSSASPFGVAHRTFDRYPLSSILDDEEFDLGNEDSNWMSLFIPGSEMSKTMKLINPDYNALKESPFNNKIVVIGLSTEVIHDVKSTPYYNYKQYKNLMPGAEIHANAIQQVIDENYISVPTHTINYSKEGFVFQFLLIFLLSLLVYFILIFFNPIWSAILIVLEMIIWVNLSIGAFVQDQLWLLKMLGMSLLPESLASNMYDLLILDTPINGESVMIPLVFPLVSIIITYGLNLSHKLVSEQRDKKFLKETFSTYIAPELIDNMYKEKMKPKLGGDSGIRTAFFSDIQSFSTFSEILSATKLVELLNELLTAMTDILINHKGTLDKYEGDAILAFYGAPIPLDDHSNRALDTAIDMQTKLSELRQKWKNDKQWPEIVGEMRMRIGIHSGEIVTGNMGSKVRMNYTMMGDAVNIAARLEQAGKHYGVYNHCSKETITIAGKEKYVWRNIDKIQLVGRSKTVESVEFFGYKDKVNPEVIEMIEVFHDGLSLYYQRKWDEAILKFIQSETMEEMFKARKTNPSRVYIERCRNFKITPPNDDWDRTHTMTRK